VIVPSEFGERWTRLADLTHAAEEVLRGLDELGLHQAAAYVAMALDTMRAADPDALPTG
jgi:hypothetical protein